ELHFSSEEPTSGTGAVPVWIRDEWSASEKTVREDAQAAGADSAIVSVFLPQRSADELRKALVAYSAAEATLQARGNPATREGQEARQGMETRQREQWSALDQFVGDVLKSAKVFQGGGNEIAADDLRSS